MLLQIILKYLSVHSFILTLMEKQQTRKETTAQLQIGFYRIHILHFPQKRNASYITYHLIH